MHLGAQQAPPPPQPSHSCLNRGSDVGSGHPPAVAAAPPGFSPQTGVHPRSHQPAEHPAAGRFLMGHRDRRERRGGTWRKGPTQDKPEYVNAESKAGEQFQKQSDPEILKGMPHTHSYTSNTRNRSYWSSNNFIKSIAGRNNRHKIKLTLAETTQGKTHQELKIDGRASIQLRTERSNQVI